MDADANTLSVSKLYTTEHATEAVTIIKNIHTFNICFNDHCTLLFYESGIESISFNIVRYSELMPMTLPTVSGLLMKHLTPVTNQLAAIL